MKKKGVVLTVVIFTVATMLSGCGLIDSLGWGDKKKAAPAEEEKEKQVLRMTTEADPPTLDSATALDGSSFNVLNNVMEGLMRLDKDNKPQPAMAEAMPKVSADKKSYTFKIRKNAKWSDGKAVKAQDFVYAWKRALNPRLKLQSAVILFPIVNAQAYYGGQLPETTLGIKALDDRTLQVNLRYPTPYFLSMLASAAYLPQRQDIVKKYGQEYGTNKDTMVYNGPFILSKWKHEQGYQYKKNKGYWDAKTVQLEKADVKIVSDSVSAMNDYTSNRSDLSPLSDKLVKAFQSGNEYQSVDRGATFLLVFNNRMKFFQNKKIRKALSLAIDRDELVNGVMKNGSRPAKGMVPDGIDDAHGKTFRKDAGTLTHYDAAEAKQLLNEGMKELGISTPPTLQLSVNDDDRKKIALFLKNEWKNNLGIDVSISPRAIKQKLAAEQRGMFNLSLVRWIGRYNDPMSFLEIGYSQSQVNFGRWSNADFDRLMEKSKVTKDLKQRNEDLVKAEKIVMDDAGVSPLFYESQAYVQKPYVKQLYRLPIGPEYSLKWTYIQGREQQPK
ncbi:oligopeptide transport system substrate-binding protein [Marininema mesophilum]|uniref:Oligopeptide transport system substrate-binding protein n=1 Tax=Marininema mesophilum TaxID=1048340 RepID=A0A1H2YK10_9BACL|nr:peptide ABC transporter substrate-binding protein [Marininema mesophilum]SDX05496.1 oligopeptide transport system substrate-binding protein [Marininema mesophilum]